MVPTYKAAAREAMQEKDAALSKLRSAEELFHKMKEERDRLVNQVDGLSSRLSDVNEESVRYRRQSEEAMVNILYMYIYSIYIV
jgi:hypothetical protein